MDEIDLVLENEPFEENNFNLKIFEQFTTILSKFSNLKTHFAGIQNDIKLLEKNVKREIKKFKKVVDKKNHNKKNKKPSGFAAPSKVSNELCKFLNKDIGSNIARTEVTKAIIDYIDTNKLTLKENKKIIIVPDEKLKILLGFEETNNEPLTYFTLQKFMNKHFIKQTSNEEL
uniref:DM2 domain-containing protein n=1 Tax=viral metagenome TaxID=1070528 RepID=A0A6C0F3E6_9ZZZZ